MVGCPHPGTGSPCPSCIEEQFGDDDRDPFGYLREDARTDGGGRYFVALRHGYRRLDRQVATDGGALARDDSPTCERCHIAIPRTPGRFTFRLFDDAESSGSLLAGRLCSGCWDDLVAYMEGAQVKEPGHPSLRTDGGAVMAPTPEADGGREWMPGGGVVADRTNELIEAVIRLMHEQGAYQLQPHTLDDIAERVLPVGSEKTLEEYRRRALEHGPFEWHGATLRWELLPEYREGRR